MPMPSCYITNPSTGIIQTTTREASHALDLSQGAKNIFEYWIVFMAQDADSARCEAKLDVFQKEIMETLQANVQLGDVGDVTTSTVVEESWTMEVKMLDATKLGTAQQGRYIRLRLWKHIT